MSCEICGYAYCNSSHSCPECARRRQPVNPMVKEHVDAGQQFGESLIKIFAAFFLNPYLCLVSFSGLGFLGMLVGWQAATVENPWANQPETFDVLWQGLPIWYRVVSIAVPVSVAVFFRKYIRPLMKWIFIIGVTGLVIWGIVAMAIHLKNR